MSKSENKNCTAAPDKFKIKLFRCEEKKCESCKTITGDKENCFALRLRLRARKQEDL